MLIYHLIYEKKGLLSNVEKRRDRVATISVTLLIYLPLNTKLTMFTSLQNISMFRWQINRSFKLNHKRLHDFPVTIPTCYKDVYRVRQIDFNSCTITYG